MQLNKEVGNFLSSMKAAVDFFGKCIPIVVFLSTFLGASLMFSFAKDHAINFVDLLQGNVIVALGTISAFFISVLALAVVAVMIIPYLQSRYIVQSFIQRSKIDWVKRKRKTAVILMCFFNSFWGLIFLIKSGFYVTLVLALYSSIIITYILFFTKNFIKGGLIRKHVFHSFCCLVSTFIPAFICLITAVLIISFFERDLKGVSELVGVASIIFLYFFLTMLPLLLCFKKGSHQITPLLCCAVFFAVFFLLAFPLSSAVSVKVVNVTGIGFKKACYLKKDIIGSNIPESLMKEHRNSYELNVLAELNDVFYLTSDIDGPAIAAFRFKSSNLKSIGCPSIPDTKIVDAGLI